MPRATAVRSLGNYVLWIQYEDGVAGKIDLSDRVGRGVFAAWIDSREFDKVHIGPSGEIAWTEQIDLCPDALYLRITGKKPEDIFPALAEMLQYA